MNKRPVAVICVFFIIGIFLAACLPKLLNLTNAFTLTLIFILLCWFLVLISCRGGFQTRPYGSKNIARSSSRLTSSRLAPLLHTFLFLSIISLGALLYLSSNIFPPNHISYFLGRDKVKAEITGVIKSPAEARGVYYGKVSSRYVFEVEQISNPYRSAIGNTSSDRRSEEGRQRVNGLALIRIQTEKDYQYGDRLMVKGTIKRPDTKNIARSSPKLAPLLQHSLKSEPKTNFNYKQYLENQNIFAIINASEKNVTLLSHNYKSNPVIRFAYFVREKIKNQFLEKMPLESGAFLRAILLGDRSELPKKLNESFRNSGTMHILPLQCRRKYSFSPESSLTL